MKLVNENGILKLNGVYVDFDDVSMRLIKKSAHNTNQPVAKAIGRQAKFVVDLTCGLAKDSYLFLSMGCRVIGVERNQVVYDLVRNGIDRALANPEHEELRKFELIHSEASEFLLKLEERPDAIYIDPMYPPRNTSALPKKEIQVLRELLSADLEQDPEQRDHQLKELLELAIQKTNSRIVLKRPTWLKPLEPPKVSFEGKLVRYDVYVP